MACQRPTSPDDYKRLVAASRAVLASAVTADTDLIATMQQGWKVLSLLGVSPETLKNNTVLLTRLINEVGYSMKLLK